MVSLPIVSAGPEQTIFSALHVVCCNVAGVRAPLLQEKQQLSRVDATAPHTILQTQEPVAAQGKILYAVQQGTRGCNGQDAMQCSIGYSFRPKMSTESHNENCYVSS